MTTTATRSLAGIALLAGALALVPATANAATANAATGPSATASAAQAQAPKTWGVYYAPGRGAKAYGKLSAAPKDGLGDPTPLVKVTGTIVDLKRSRSCGWALFRISYDDGKHNVPFTRRTFISCAYGKAKKFAFQFKNVYFVEFKVCAEPRAKEPSLNCLYGGSWKSLYSHLEG